MQANTKIKVIFTVALVALGIQSCFKAEEYPLEPEISNAVVSVSGDSAIVSFDFTDGDADLGLPPSDTFGVYAPESYYYNNIYLDYYEKDDAQGWVPGLDLDMDTIRFGYRIKPIEVSKNTEGIKGTIDVTIESFKNPFSSQSDTVKFRIKLIDRALNESNVIETDEITSQ